MNDGVHVAGVIVRARGETAPALAERIARCAGVEVHAVQDGKIIVVLESATETGLADQMDAIRGEPGVFLVNLVYHEVETA